MELLLFIHNRTLPCDILLEAEPVHPVLQPERTRRPVLVEELPAPYLCRIRLVQVVLGRGQAVIERLEQSQARQRGAALGGELAQTLDALAAVVARVGARAEGGRGAGGEEDERGAEDGVCVVPGGTEAWGVGAVFGTS